MTINDIKIGMSAKISVHDETNSFEREVSIVDRDMFDPHMVTVSSIYEKNEEDVHALVILDYGVVNLLVSINGSYYSAEVNGVKVTRKGNQAFYLLKLGKEELNTANRRQYKRFPITAEAEIYINGNEYPYHGYLKDISYAGLCFGITEPMESIGLGSFIRIVINHNETSIPLSVMGCICNSRPGNPERETALTYYGVSLSAEYQQIRGLVNRIERKELQMLRHQREMGAAAQ